MLEKFAKKFESPFLKEEVNVVREVPEAIQICRKKETEKNPQENFFLFVLT
jgi:hypothetical protein